MTDLRELGTLVVVVGKARNLPNKSRFGKQDPFCTVNVGDEKQRTKAIKRGGQHPEWDEELRFTINEDTDDLLIRSESQQFDSLSSKHTSLSSHTNPSHPTPPPKDGTPSASLNSSLSGSVTAQALASKSRKGPIGKKGGKSMKVACFADDAKEPELIGEVTVPIDEVLKLGEVDEWYEFSFKDKYSGEVYLELTFYSNDAPPVKRNVPRPSVHPYDLMPSSSSSSSSLSGRQGGLAASGSVSGMNLYIPPYVEAARISPGPPPGSGGFADLGLPSGHRHSLAGSINSMDALTRPMSGLSINTPPAQQTPPRAPPPQAYGGHGHRHSVGGQPDAPWSHDMPQQQPHIPALLRPVSAAQSSTGYNDPRRGTPQPYHDSRTTTPVPGIPNSLLPGQEPRPHAHSFSGPSRPIVPPPHPTYLQPSPGPTPTPPPHPSSAPPVQLQPHYQVPVSSYAPPGQVYDQRSNTPYQDVRQGLPQPPPSRSNSLPVRAPSPQPPPPQQGYYPDRSYTPRPTYPGGQSPLPPQQTTPGYPPQQDYNRQNYPGSSQVEDHYQNQHQSQPAYGQIQPPPEPAREPTPNNQGYIPWYQQTQPTQPPAQQYDPPPPQAQPQPHYDPYQQHQQSYTPAPPPVPPHRPASAQPIAPPRPAVGYYPSDELYAQEPPRNTYQPPQPPPRGSTPQPPPWQQQAPQPPPRGSTPQPPSWQQQQQQRPVSPQPPIPGSWQQQQQPDPYSYQNQAPPQPQPQQYDQRYSSPAPPQSHPSSSYPQQPTSSYPQQATYPPQQNYSQTGYQPIAPSPPPAPPGWQSAIPQAQQPPRGVSPAPARAPSPLPTQMGQDWRSYLQSLPTPGRTPSPVPPPQHHQQQQYVPPPSLPGSLKPPEGWQSSVPTSNDGHQWKR